MPSKAFTYTGDWVRWDKPNKVKWVSVIMEGAGSGGVQGGRVEGRINVENVSVLWVLVGQQGKAPVGSTGGGTSVGGGGRGGNGTSGNPGGHGGGGATVIRAGSRTGAIRALAAGAGGASGDSGRGGRGGTEVGEAGSPAAGYPGYIEDSDPPDYPNIGNATGGTQVQGGNRGTSGHSSDYDGDDAPDTVLGVGGSGGGGVPSGIGGGGGGGGFRSGGGGQAGFFAESPAGGGGGGSNFTATMVEARSHRGLGSTGNGRVVLSWVSPAPANQPPTAPSEPRTGDKDITDEFASLSTGAFNVTAVVNNPERNQKVRLVAQYSLDKSFRDNVRQVHSDWVDRGKRARVRLTGLAQNSLYYVRLYAQDRAGLTSVNYNAFTFWTNRYPTEPETLLPGENAQYDELSTVAFEWSHKDPDETSSQSAFRLRWRRKATPTTPAGPWRWVTTSGPSVVEAHVDAQDSYWTEEPGTFSANTSYEWQVATRDPQGAWGVYSRILTFYITGETAPPVLESPVRGEALNVSEPITFKWTFRDPTDGETQAKADIRYRVVGTDNWTTLLGDTDNPGSQQFWILPAETLSGRVQYEWQARTQDSTMSQTSNWSDSETFWTISAPLLSTPAVTPVLTGLEGGLGCGVNRVFVYDRGGMVVRGEITPLVRVQWGRRRDDIATILVDTNGYDTDCGQLLSTLRSWVHELVVFRDGVRVAEGPIVRITSMEEQVEIEARDVMVYAYRRIMRQGYNDAYRLVNGEQVGLSTVVQRATRILMNALAPVDPNVLPYLTSLNFPDDAQLSRSIPDFSKTSWEEIDDLAATGGLDYTTVGRRIVLWDTHRPLGRLGEMRSEHFSDPPVISEYGMQLATGFGVTNNNGVYGFVERVDPEDSAYGIVEQLASAYGETEGTGTEETLTSESRARLEEVLTTQAERNIAPRYPTPVVVRVPDNSMLSPTTPVRINDLVPGVWIPLRAKTRIREVAQWQKLDQLTVEQTEQGERVMVVMSPAPNAGEDPDAVGAVEEG